MQAFTQILIGLTQTLQLAFLMLDSLVQTLVFFPELIELFIRSVSWFKATERRGEPIERGIDVTERGGILLKCLMQEQSVFFGDKLACICRFGGIGSTRYPIFTLKSDCFLIRCLIGFLLPFVFRWEMYKVEPTACTIVAVSTFCANECSARSLDAAAHFFCERIIRSGT
jgi:hypothetical protein